MNTPSPKQIKCIRNVIKGDCQIKGQNIDDKGRTCAIGALLVSAGIPKKEIRRHRSGFCSFSGLPTVWKERLCQKFGIDFITLIKIQQLNDRYSTRSERRKNILSMKELQLPKR